MKGKIGEKKVEELIKEMKGGDEDMLGCVEMVWEEGVNKGKKEERLKIAIEMKKNGLSTELIQKITRLKKQAIEKIEV